MNLNKRSTYEKFENYSDLLSDKEIVYVFGKSQKEIDCKIKKIKKFCEAKNLKPLKWISDIGVSKDLCDKPNLIKLLKDESDLDIITITSTDVSPFCTGDYFDIRRQLKENNLGVYDLEYENFYYERAPYSVWCMSC